MRRERMAVAMALAERTHHSSRGQKIARAGVWGHAPHPAGALRAVVRRRARRDATGQDRYPVRAAGALVRQWIQSMREFEEGFMDEFLTFST